MRTWGLEWLLSLPTSQLASRFLVKLQLQAFLVAEVVPGPQFCMLLPCCRWGGVCFLP